MSDMGGEELFEGGVNVVRRVGSTVVRPAGSHSLSVHRLLRHLRDRGFDRAPDALALDASNNTETLSFLPGATSSYPLLTSFRTDHVLVSAGRLLRAYHDATTDFVIADDDHWANPTVEPVEVICHGDYAPYNCVVAGDQVVGVFDFDAAHPGPRLWDIGYGAYRWVPLTSPTNADGFGSLETQSRRLRLFCDAYGEPDLSAVVEGAITRLHALVDTMRRLASSGNNAFARHVEEGHDKLYLDDIQYLIENTRHLTSVRAADHHSGTLSGGSRRHAQRRCLPPIQGASSTCTPLSTWTSPTSSVSSTPTRRMRQHCRGAPPHRCVDRGDGDVRPARGHPRGRVCAEGVGSSRNIRSVLTTDGSAVLLANHGVLSTTAPPIWPCWWAEW